MINGEYLPPEDDPCWAATEQNLKNAFAQKMSDHQMGYGYVTFHQDAYHDGRIPQSILLDRNYPVEGTEVPEINDDEKPQYTRRDAPKSIRGDMLDEAKSLVTGDRNNVYGPPNQDFQRTADMMSAYGFRVDDRPLTSADVAIFMSLLKISRLKWSPTKRDSWVDLAGYSACGLECAILDDEQGEKETNA